MAEVGAIDAFSGLSSLFQLNTQRTSINPFASVDEMSDVEQTEAQKNPFTKPDEVVEAFQLTDPKNRLKILTLFTSDQKQDAVGLLGKEGLQLAMKLYDKEKLMNFLFATSQQDISKVLSTTMPMEQAFAMLPKKSLTKFIMSKELEKADFMRAFEAYETEDLQKLMGTITGIPHKNSTKKSMLAMLAGIKIDKLQPILATTTQKMQKAKLISKMTGQNEDLYSLFAKSDLISPFANTSKSEMLQGFSKLDEEVMAKMASALPDELLPILLTMIPIEKLAKALIEKYPDVITRALAGTGASDFGGVPSISFGSMSMSSGFSSG